MVPDDYERNEQKVRAFSLLDVCRTFLQLAVDDDRMPPAIIEEFVQ